TSMETIGAEIGGDVDVRRFRPNVLLARDHSEEDFPEARWTGAHLTLGEVARAVAARAERCLGVYCWVKSGGSVRIGDQVAFQPATVRRRYLGDAARRAKRLAFGLA